MADSFYLSEGERFAPTELCVGPWSSDAQHGGPPAALLGRAIERCKAKEGFQVVRATFEILRPVPMSPLLASATLVRPGRSVELLQGVLSDDNGDVMHASAWRIRTQEVPLDRPPAEEHPPPGPDEGQQQPVFSLESSFGYHSGMEWRFVEGSFLELGPATAWLRMRYPLLLGEIPSPLTRVLIAADSGNGISASVDYNKYVFINTDLTVHLRRLPKSEWVCMKSKTSVGTHGVGLTETTLYDDLGKIGKAMQSLLIGLRPEGR